MKYTLRSGAECKRVNPMTPKVQSPYRNSCIHAGIYSKALVERVNKHQFGPPKYHWKCFKM